MPNGIEYSATIQANALQRGNVSIGTGNVGPTSTTGFISMPTPPSGKYIISEVSAAGAGPFFYSPQDDAELIRLVRQEGATGADTASVPAALSWIATQANLEAANFEYENVVTSGSLMLVDAGYVGSYPLTNTTFYDLSGTPNNGTIINGPTFNFSISGSFLLDGVDEVVDFGLGTGGSFSRGTGDVTIEAVFTPRTGNTGFQCVIGKGAAGNRGYAMFFDRAAGGTITLYQSITAPNNTHYASGTLTANTTYHVIMVYDRDVAGYVYVNGVLTHTHTGLPTQNQSMDDANYVMCLGARRTTGGANLTITNMNISVARVYNRALSSAEALQNWNSVRTRFGLV